jgi:hypothetical protein
VIELLPAAQNVLGNRLGLVLLVEMELSLPLRVAIGRASIEWNGKEFFGSMAGSMEPVKDSAGETTAMRFTLSGVPIDKIAIALAEPIQGKPVTVWVAVLNADNEQLLGVRELWAGSLDQMPLSQAGQLATITVTAEHRAVTFARPKGLRYTDADQQALFPLDRSLEYIVAQAQHQDVWPAAAFFQR